MTLTQNRDGNGAGSFYTTVESDTDSGLLSSLSLPEGVGLSITRDSLVSAQ